MLGVGKCVGPTVSWASVTLRKGGVEDRESHFYILTYLNKFSGCFFQVICYGVIVIM